MANIERDTLVMKDSEGNYFLVPHETVEQGRVPEEQRAEIERLIGEADTTGHIDGGLGVVYGTLAPTASISPLRVTFQDFHFVARVSKSSPLLR
jgi:hypothetical protein